jgi:hypothetical protein
MSRHLTNINARKDLHAASYIIRRLLQHYLPTGDIPTATWLIAKTVMGAVYRVNR